MTLWILSLKLELTMIQPCMYVFRYYSKSSSSLWQGGKIVGEVLKPKRGGGLAQW